MNQETRRRVHPSTIIASVIIGIVVFFGGLWLYENTQLNNDNSYNNNNAIIESKYLDRSDFTLELKNNGWTSVYAVVVPKRGIKEIVLKVEYYDKNKSVVKTETKTFNNLDANSRYELEFKNTIFESLKYKSYSIKMISGLRG